MGSSVCYVRGIITEVALLDLFFCAYFVLLVLLFTASFSQLCTCASWNVFLSTSCFSVFGRKTLYCCIPPLIHGYRSVIMWRTEQSHTFTSNGSLSLGIKGHVLLPQQPVYITCFLLTNMSWLGNINLIQELSMSLHKKKTDILYFVMFFVVQV